jgi:hypothetical protein
VRSNVSCDQKIALFFVTLVSLFLAYPTLPCEHANPWFSFDVPQSSDGDVKFAHSICHFHYYLNLATFFRNPGGKCRSSIGLFKMSKQARLCCTAIFRNLYETSCYRKRLLTVHPLDSKEPNQEVEGGLGLLGRKRELSYILEVAWG